MRAHPAPGLRNHRERGHALLSRCWSHPQMSSRFHHFHCQSRRRAVHHRTTRSSKPGFYHSCSRWWGEHAGLKKKKFKCCFGEQKSKLYSSTLNHSIELTCCDHQVEPHGQCWEWVGLRLVSSSLGERWPGLGCIPGVTETAKGSTRSRGRQPSRACLGRFPLIPQRRASSYASRVRGCC